MSAQPSTSRGGTALQEGPAWGLKEQLSRLGGKNGINNSRSRQGGTGEQSQDREAAAAGGERSKIRVSVTGPALAHKIEQVQQ